MFINSLRKSPFSCSPGLILLGAFTLLSVPVYGQQIQQVERQMQQVPFLQFNFDEQGGETARNSGSGGSKYDARINGGTVEWGPGLQQGAARLRTLQVTGRSPGTCAGNFAVDENYGTHWDSGVGAHKPWLIVDLGSECKMNEIETISEFTSRTYKYKLEYLSQKEAGSLDAASGSHCERAAGEIVSAVQR